MASDPLAPVPPASLVLHRGGEELLLTKVPDRFTVQLVDPGALETVTATLGLAPGRPVAQGQLVEWVVPPEQLEATLTQARSLAAVQFASHVYSLQASPQTWLYLTDEITVQFAPTLSPPEQARCLEGLGLVEPTPLVGIPQAWVYRVGPQAPANPIKLAQTLMAQAGVLLAEPNVAIATALLYRPLDPLYAQQWHLSPQSSGEVAPNAHISVEGAWDLTRGSRSVVVAIADDGFDLDHPDLQGAGKIVAPRDLQAQNSVPLPRTADENHGTACAGLAIGEENQTGIVGVAPGCSFMPIRTTGYLDDSSMEGLFQWAMAQGAAVISCSWSPAAVYYPLSLRQRAAITQAATQGRGGLGCVILFSAGNANRPVSGTLQEQGWPRNALQGATTWLSGFAVHPDVLAVSACTSLNRKAAYSNWGSHISLCAPSNNGAPSMALPQVGSVATGPVLSQRLPGRGMVTSDRLQGAGYDPSAFTDGFGGTSSACPVAAGVAALVLSVNPDLTARQVRQILEQTADKITDPNPDPQLGLRHGTYDRQGHSLWFGYGRVNAQRAVQRALALRWAPTGSGRPVELREEGPIPIPDDRATPLVRSLRVGDRGTVQAITVGLAIDHDYLGDLTMTLTPPHGAPILLQGRTLGQQQHLRHHYTLSTTPALRTALNRPALGDWRLTITDHAPGHRGTVLQWQLLLVVGG